MLNTATATTNHTGVQPNLRTIPPPAPSGPVTASLNFFVPPSDGSPARYLVDSSPTGKPVENFGCEAIPVPLTDIRGFEPQFSVIHDAFAALRGVPSDPSIDWDDDTSVKSKYYPEVERLLLDTLRGDGGLDDKKIVIFDHTIRLADPKAYREPVLRAHVDQTAFSTAQRVRRHTSTPKEAQTLLEGRYRIINVWRPLTRGPVTSYPLGFASASSASASDIVPIQHVYPDGYIGEHAGVRHNPAHLWYYWSGMTGDERLLLQCFDSKVGEDGGRTPHTAFVDPRTPDDAEPRRSIEVRALVFG